MSSNVAYFHYNLILLFYICVSYEHVIISFLLKYPIRIAQIVNVILLSFSLGKYIFFSDRKLTRRNNASLLNALCITWCVMTIVCIQLNETVLILTSARVTQWVRWLDYLTTHTSLSPIRRVFAPGFVNYKKGALDLQPQVIKLTSCLSMVGGSFRVLRLLPPIKLVAMI